MSKPKILYYSILQYQESNLTLLRDQFDLIELQDPSKDTDEILARVDVILAPLGYKVDRQKIDRCTQLSVIGSNTTGHPHIDVEYAEKKGVKVVTLKPHRDFLNQITPTAEFAWGLIIALTRNMIPAIASVKEGRWDRRPFGSPKMLSRMTIGVVGLGRLGSKVAQYATSFGSQVIYYDPDVTSKIYQRIDKLKKLVSQSDVVTLHVPHEKETENLFSEELFSHFKPGAYFVNTSRGELVDHAALLEVLKNKKLAGAAVDVFEGEYVPGFQTKISQHKLWQYARDYNNLIITPHIAGSTIDAWEETERFTIDKILEAFQIKK